MEDLLTPTTPVAFDRPYPIAPRAPSIAASSYYYSHPSASTTSSSTPDLTTASTASTVSTVSPIITNDSDSDDNDHDDSSGERPLPTVRPKVEEVDDLDTGHATSLHEITDAKPPVGVVSLPSPPPRKKRGRPRKHPIVDPAEHKKTAHARSKTGCGTCRRRKKKCDEAKPICMNCEKNNVVCDGYEPKHLWRSGKQKALQAVYPSLPTIAIRGIETDLDRRVFHRFVQVMAHRLSLTDQSNPFQVHILSMANANPAVMHSVLYLASSWLLASAHDGSPDMAERRQHHRNRALGFLLDGAPPLPEDRIQTWDSDKSSATGTQVVTVQPHPLKDASAVAKKPRLHHLDITQALIFCLETVANGDVAGGYRPHVHAMKNLLIEHRHDFPDERLRHFILEFLLYHDFSSSITNIEPTLDERSRDLMKDFELPQFVPPDAGSLLGVLDGLFGFMSNIRSLRNTIRARKVLDPNFCWIAHAQLHEEVYAIDNEIRDWKCRYPPGSPRFKASMLYRQMTWVYLWRTVSPSRSHEALKIAMDDALKLLNELPWREDAGAMQSVLLLPVFLLGCAAFEHEQRQIISEAFSRLKTWSSLGNIARAESIVQEVWQLMDQGREDESWDWETLIQRRGWDLLIT